MKKSVAILVAALPVLSMAKEGAADRLVTGVINFILFFVGLFVVTAIIYGIIEGIKALWKNTRTPGKVLFFGVPSFVFAAATTYGIASLMTSEDYVERQEGTVLLWSVIAVFFLVLFFVAKRKIEAWYERRQMTKAQKKPNKKGPGPLKRLGSKIYGLLFKTGDDGK